jgi:hypothetical protein
MLCLAMLDEFMLNMFFLVGLVELSEQLLSVDEAAEEEEVDEAACFLTLTGSLGREDEPGRGFEFVATLLLLLVAVCLNFLNRES